MKTIAFFLMIVVAVPVLVSKCAHALTVDARLSAMDRGQYYRHEPRYHGWGIYKRHAPGYRADPRIYRAPMFRRYRDDYVPPSQRAPYIQNDRSRYAPGCYIRGVGYVC